MTKFKSKYIVFSVIAVMMGYVLYHNERFLVEPSNPLWAHFAPFRWWLLPHGILGACTLLLAPFQFSNRLRKRFTRAHRVVGRIYVVGALGLAPLGAYIQYYQERMGFPRSFSVLAAVDAAMLITTTAIAFLFAYKRKIKEHQQWVTRSYAVALVFIGGRFVMGVTGWELLSIEIVQAIIWSCLALSVPIADVMNNWREIRDALSKVKTRAPALPPNLSEGVVETI